ncbi:MAG: DUF3467 domain-containing protein [Desulfobacteraceae bacterium]|nr:DUF3467 domain-containing protein [Desulfobacteraceae bacterium]
MANEKGRAETTAGASKVKWDDSNMKTSYANICHVSSTREEVTLLFGTNQTLLTGQGDVTVQLSNRLILSPFAAKRLITLLGNIMGEYERRFGSLNVDVAPVPPTPAEGEAH